MAQIDKFLALLTKYPADGILFSANERVALVAGDQRRPASAQPVTASQVQDLVQEILPVDTTQITATNEGREFVYDAPVGRVAVRVRGTSATMQFEVRLQPVPAQLAAALPPPAVVTTPPAAPRAVTPSAPPGAGSRPRIDTLFHKMIQNKCSDLHLSVGNPPLFRKDGEMVSLGETTPLENDALREMLLEITPELNRDEFAAHHDTDFSYEIANVARFRSNLFVDRRGVGAVFRVIPSKIPTAQELGLPQSVLDLCNLQKGLVLVTGPTGSGKSTTLAAMVDYVNSTRSAHVITIEDPIEFVYASKKCLVNQREVRNHTDGFKQALRAALREDPDIVLVGEMRDLETVAIAIETAETGHLVFGTLHTNTAAGAVDRIIDQFPTDRQAQIRTMLSESLRGVVAQMLLKKKGGGRVAAQEILIVTPAISNLIREGKTFQIVSLMQTGRAVGMVTMNDALMEVVKGGTVDPDEALAKAPNRSEFKAMLDRGGVKTAAPREAVATA